MSTVQDLYLQSTLAKAAYANPARGIPNEDKLSNETTTAELRRDVEKLDVLMHAVLYSSTSYLVSTPK